MSKKPFIVVGCLVAMIALSFSFKGKDPGYKNLQVLPKDITSQQLDSVMQHFSDALNVDCGFCHVENESKTDMIWESDENKHKLVAREMMLMTNRINDSFFNYTGEPRTITTSLMVTCYTCHHGSKVPSTSK